MQDTETRIIKEYNDYMLQKSIFRDTLKILPSTPQSFATFPTIIVREMNDTQNVGSTTTNYQEHASNKTYQVDIYTKTLTVGNKKYQARNVMSELKLLTCNFFMNCHFIRTSGTNGEYPDITVDRYVLIFNSTRNNWNGNFR